MNLYSIISQGRKVTIKNVLWLMSFVCAVFILSGTVDALQTALVRTSDGSVYQIRFRNKALTQNYRVSDFVDDFSIYNETGEVKLCLDSEEVTWELYTAARILANTPLETPIFDTSALVEALYQAIEDLGVNIVTNETVGLVVEEIISHTFLARLDIVPQSGPLATIAIPANLIAKLGNIEIKMRRLLYAFWIASGFADTAIILQEQANQRTAELWASINAGEVIDISGDAINVDVKSGQISGNMSVDGPLRLRLAAQVYQENAEAAAKLGADLGTSDNAWSNWFAGLTKIGDILQLFPTVIDAGKLKRALGKLQDHLGGKIERSIRRNIVDVYDSAK